MSTRNLAFFLIVLVPGCDTSYPPDTCRTPPCHPPFGSLYVSPTVPENLLYNLQVSYRNREIEHYAQLLAPELIFQFQPIDANDIGTQFWTRDQDSKGTRALLTTTLVSEIRINLTYSGRDTTINFPGTPLDSLKIRIITTDLQVDQTDGITWVVTDQQDLFFRKGLPAKAENPNYWWIYEWDDLPTLSAPAIAVRSITWGSLKARY